MARQHARPEDFELVGMSQDPTPGDPDLIEPIRVRYQNIGDAAEQARTTLNKDGSITQGRGAAMESLKKQVGDELPDRLNKVATSYHEAAQAYQAYMPRLREAQEKFDQAVEAAQQAAPTANQTAPTLGAEPTDEEKAGADQKNAEIAAGQSALNSAKGIAEQAKQMRESAQRDLESVLDDAAGQAFKVSIFQKIKNFFDDFPFVQILLAILIAVVAVFFPIIGLILGAGLFLLNQVVASQTGGIKPGDFILGALSIIPGGSLLGAGGKGLQVAGRLLGKNANLFGKAPGAVSGSLNSIKNVSAINKTLNNPVVGNIVGIGGTFAKNFSAEVAGQGIDGAFNGQDAAGIAGVLAGGALGALGGRGGKGGRSKNPFSIPNKTSNSSPPGTLSRSGPGGVTPNLSTNSGPSTSNATPSTSNAPPAVTAPPPAAPNPAPGPAVHNPVPAPPAALNHFGTPTNNASGGVDLLAHEGLATGGPGTGHTIARHVNKTTTDLEVRMTTEGKKVASAFSGSQADAERLVAANMSDPNNVTKINNFLHPQPPPPTTSKKQQKKPKIPDRLELTMPISPTDGISRMIDPTTGAFVDRPVTKIFTLLKRDNNFPGGFQIVTSYPT
jgi:hypothetical protein